MQDYSALMLQPKGFGDESKRPPQQPHVPLSSSGPKLQNLLDFLEAAPLSPTSHKIHRGYGDRRTTREPPKAERDTDHEYRRAARSALGVKLAWSFLEELSDCGKLDAPTKIRAMRTVLDTFRKDVDSTMDYQVIRAVHHRRNLIDFATKDMPQDDIRLAIQELPLPTTSTLFHESAAAKVEAVLLRPEGRQLAAIRDREQFRRRFQSAPQTGRHHSTVRRGTQATSADKPSPSHQAPSRKPTRPAPPPAPARDYKPSTAGKKGKGSSWKSSSSSFPRRPGPPADKRGPAPKR